MGCNLFVGTRRPRKRAAAPLNNLGRPPVKQEQDHKRIKWKSEYLHSENHDRVIDSNPLLQLRLDAYGQPNRKATLPRERAGSQEEKPAADAAAAAACAAIGKRQGPAANGKKGSSSSSSSSSSKPAKKGSPPKSDALAKRKIHGESAEDYKLLSLAQTLDLMAKRGESSSEAACAACDHLKSQWWTDVSQSADELGAALGAMVRVGEAHAADERLMEKLCSAVRMLCMGQSAAGGEEASSGSEDEQQPQQRPKQQELLRGEKPSAGDGKAAAARRHVRSEAFCTTRAHLADLCLSAGVPRVIVAALQDRKLREATGFAFEALRAVCALAKAYDSAPGGDAQHHTRQSTLIEAGCVGACIEVMTQLPGSEQVNEAGATALYHLLEPSRSERAEPSRFLEATQQRKAQAIAQKALPALRAAAAAFATHQSLQAAALRALSSLVGEGAAEGSRVAAAEALPEVVAAMLGYSWNRRIQLHACRILCAVCDCGPDAKSIELCRPHVEAAAAGALRAVVKLLSAHQSHHALLLPGMKAVQLLCRGGDAHANGRKQLVVELNALPLLTRRMLVALGELSTSDGTAGSIGGGTDGASGGGGGSERSQRRRLLLLQHGCAAIAAVSAGTSSKALARKAVALEKGALEVVVGALRSHMADSGVAREGCRCYAQLGAWESLGARREGGLELILQAMRTHAEDAEVCEQGCHAIVDLCRGTDDSGLQHKQHAASLGALDLLVDALRKFGPTDEHHLEACCLALSTLCTGSDEAGLQRKHTAAGAIELLIEPLRNAAEPKTQERGCALLRNLCTGQDERGLQRKKRAREAVSEEPKLPLL